MRHLLPIRNQDRFSIRQCMCQVNINLSEGISIMFTNEDHVFNGVEIVS